MAVSDQNAANRFVGVGNVLVVRPGVGVGNVLVPRRERTASLGNVLVVAPTVRVAEAQLVVRVPTQRRLPDTLSGITEADTFSLQILDPGRLLKSPFLTDDQVNARVQIIAYDRRRGTRRRVAVGQVTGYSVLRHIEAQCAEYDAETFQVQLPRYKVVTDDPTGGTIQDVDPNDVTTVFSRAVDFNGPISFVFGRAPWVPLLYVFEDEETDRYDYIICEGLADVASVQTDITTAGVFVEKFSRTFSIVAATATTVTLDPPPAEPSFEWVGLYLRIDAHVFRPDAVGLERQIVSLDEATGVVTVDSPWGIPIEPIAPGGTPVTGTNITRVEVREYQTLRASPYYGRTVVRFARRQAQDSTLAGMRGTVVRYRPPRKNMAPFSEELWDPARWEHGPIRDTPPSRAEDLDGGQTAALLRAGQTRTLHFTLPTTAPTSFVISAFVRRVDGGTGGAVQAQLQPEGAASITSGTIAVGAAWARRQTTLTAVPAPTPGATARLTLRAVGGDVLVWGVQLERGLRRTAYEHTGPPGLAHTDNVVWAIEELLTAHWGCRKSVVATEFEAAAEALDALQLRVHGSVPYVDGTTPISQDLLSDLLRMRGMSLEPRGGSWGIAVDQPTTPRFLFGDAETVYEPLVSVSPITRRVVGEDASRLVLQYGGILQATTNNPILAYRYEYDIGGKKVGEPLEEAYWFIHTHGTAQKVGAYRAARLQTERQQWSVTLPALAADAHLRDVVQLVVPEVQPENRLVSSEDFTHASWAGTGTIAAKTRILDPAVPGRSASTLTGAGAQVVGGFTDTVGLGACVVLRVWLRGHTAATVSIQLDVGSETIATTKVVGGTWIDYALRVVAQGTAVPQATITLDSGGPVDVFAHALFEDVDRPYVRTAGAPIAPQELWRIVGISRDSERPQVDLVPYRPDVLYAFTPRGLPNEPFATTGEDTTFLGPAAPTNLVLPPSAPAITGDAWTAIGSEGAVGTWIRVRVIMPIRAVRLVVQFRLREGLAFWADGGSVSVTDVPPGSVASVVISGLTPGLEYAIRAVAFDARGRAAATAPGYYVAHGDDIPPALPVAITAAQGTGRSVRVHFTFGTPDGRPPADYRHATVYRSRDEPSFNEATVVGATTSNVFTDTGLVPADYGHEFRWWVVLVDKTFNAQVPYGPTTPLLLQKVVGLDEIVRLSADEIVTGTLRVTGPGPGQEGADSVEIVEAAGAEIAFLDAAGDRRAAIDYSSDGANRWRLLPDAANTLYLDLGDNTKILALLSAVAQRFRMAARNGGADSVVLESIFNTLRAAATNVTIAATQDVQISSSTLRVGGAVLKTGAAAGAVSRVIEVRDLSGTLLGYLPIYATKV